MRKQATEMVIGDWWAPCCLHDLTQVADADDLATLLDNEFLMFKGGWDTCAEAVAELVQECDQAERQFLLDWYRGQGANESIARELERYVVYDA